MCPHPPHHHHHPKSPHVDPPPTDPPDPLVVAAGEAMARCGSTSRLVSELRHTVSPPHSGKWRWWGKLHCLWGSVSKTAHLPSHCHHRVPHTLLFHPPLVPLPRFQFLALPPLDPPCSALLARAPPYPTCPRCVVGTGAEVPP